MHFHGVGSIVGLPKTSEAMAEALTDLVVLETFAGFKSGTDYLSIETVNLKALQPGEEVTVVYGSKYTKMIRTAAAIEAIAIKRDKSINGNTLICCDLCSFILLKRRLKLHRGHILGCITRQKLSQERLVILEHKLMKTKKCLVQP